MIVARIRFLGEDSGSPAPIPTLRDLAELLRSSEEVPSNSNLNKVGILAH